MKLRYWVFGVFLMHSFFPSGDNMVTSSSLRGHYTHNHPHYIFLKEQHRKLATNKEIHRHIISILWDSEQREGAA